MKTSRSRRLALDRTDLRSTIDLQALPKGHFCEFDVAVEPQPLMEWPQVSVCMIVRNEAADIGPCLSSIGDLASEIIVVDTGSNDNTPTIAEECGARVYHFPWIDDFAAARNESIRHARGEWIFWLDADDRLNPKTIAQLKVAARAAVADAYMCLVSSCNADGSTDVTQHIRLFRNGLGIQFSGAIHETVYPDIVYKGLRLGRTDISIQHTGYDSPETIRRKCARNLAMIERQLALHPEHVDLIFYRGQARSPLNDWDGAEADMREYLARTKPSKQRFEYKRFWAYVIISRLRDKRGDLQGMEAILNEALGEFPGHPALLVQIARLHLALGRPLESIEELHAARKAMEGTVRGLRPSEAAPEVSLAESYMALEQLSEAIKWAEKAHTIMPEWPHPTTVLARLYLDVGKIREAASLLNSLLPTATSPDPWLVMADFLFKQNRYDDAIGAVERARELGLPDERSNELISRLKAAKVLEMAESRPSDLTRQIQAKMDGLACLARGEHVKAVEILQEALQQPSADPQLYKYLAVALRALGREEEALEAWKLGTQCQVPA